MTGQLSLGSSMQTTLQNHKAAQRHQIDHEGAIS